jgi:N-sulfoglucosamine sulfohydrolase
MLTFLASFVFALSVVTPNDPPPNVLWIIADDLGPQLGCYGTRGVRTPNLDRLASEGMRFTQAFSPAPVCSTSRSAFITGVSQTATGCQHHRTPIKRPLPPGVTPLPALLAEAGIPSFNGSFNLKKRGKSDYNFQWTGAPLYKGPNWEGTEEPFFAQVQIFEPHRGFKKNALPARELALELPPWLPEDPLARADEAGYLSSIEVLDRKVGNILDRLEAAGLTETTLVIFIGDHGRPQVRGKQWLYDAGIHVPMIVRWPGMVEPGTVNTSMTSLIDLAPTTLAAFNLEIPLAMQGRVVVGPRTGVDPGMVFSARDRCDETVDGVRAVRTNEFKYIRNLLPSKQMLQPNRYKDRSYPMRSLLRTEGAMAWAETPRVAEELYVLKDDPHELNNVAGDPGFADVQRELSHALDAWMLSCGDAGATPEDPASLEKANAQAEAARVRVVKKTGIDPILDPKAWLQRERDRLETADSDGWRAMWRPGSFDGWHAHPGGEWTWEDDVLVGRSEASEARHGLLVSDFEFGDFDVELEFRAITGCSGFYFRVEETAGRTGVAGFQAEVEPSFETGGLYETRGRAWVVKADQALVRSCYTPGEWASMRVVANGGDVVVYVNGVETARLTNDSGRRTGRFALQLHGGQALHVEFRSLRIRLATAEQEVQRRN